MKIIIGLTLLLLLSPGRADNVDIEVLALFKDTALLRIAGKQTLLKTGDRSSEGILLISANSREAVVEVSGETMILNLSQRISSTYRKRTEASVSIFLNKNGQYRTTGSINGRPVSFLVDTGATVVAINSLMAREIGIDVSKGKVTLVVTASGKVESRMVSLDIVQVGDIEVRNVQAVIIPGSYPEDVLLGMSFLRGVEIHEASGVMRLSAVM